MKRKFSGKGLLLLVVMTATLGLAGCDFIVGLFDPLIGTWTGSSEGQVYTAELHGDRTFSLSVTSEGQTLTSSGTYSVDSAAKVLTWSFTQSDWEEDGPTAGTIFTFRYGLSANNSKLTLTPVSSEGEEEEGGLAFTRQQ